jgi:hypothetical protein
MLAGIGEELRRSAHGIRELGDDTRRPGSIPSGRRTRATRRSSGCPRLGEGRLESTGRRRTAHGGILTEKKRRKGMVAAAGRGEGWFGGARVCGAIKKRGRAGGRGVVGVKRCDVCEGAHALCVEEDDNESRTASEKEGGRAGLGPEREKTGLLPGLGKGCRLRGREGKGWANGRGERGMLEGG